MNRINRRLDAADDALRAALLRWRAPGWLPGALTLAAFFLLMMTRTLAQLAGLPLGARAAGVATSSCVTTERCASRGRSPSQET